MAKKFTICFAGGGGNGKDLNSLIIYASLYLLQMVISSTK
jgi:hypothetical protein